MFDHEQPIYVAPDGGDEPYAVAVSPSVVGNPPPTDPSPQPLPAYEIADSGMPSPSYQSPSRAVRFRDECAYGHDFYEPELGRYMSLIATYEPPPEETDL